MVAGVVAVVATGGAALGLVLGGTMTFAGISAATIATIASVISAVATIGSQQLAKPPPARGSVTQILVQPDAPQPYVMGEGYFAGVLRHDTAYGATLKKVPNPYRFMAIVYSGGGPIESITPQIDFAAIGGWFSGFLYTDTQLGACPETTALAPHWSGTPGWDSTSKLSGLAAIGWSLLFDKNGKVFANGVPLIGAYGQWVKVYDPRLDSTFPGGSGSHRLGDETTYEWSECPALHAGTYAYGRYQNGKRVMGMGLPAEGIDWNVIAAWANVCDANDWTMFGVVYEGVGPGESERRWDNLKDICFAGGAEPIAGGILTFKYSAPVVALDTITADDLTDDDCSVTTMQSFRDRINTVIPKYRSPTHNWELVDAEPVVNSTFLAEDGQEKRDVWPFNFVKDAQQATELAAYRMFDTREIPVTLVCKPRLRAYRPGECLHLDLPELGLDIDAIILTRQIDPVTMVVTLDLITETTAKHAYCLGLTGVAPPTPAVGQTSQERDELAAAAAEAGYITALIATSYTIDADPADGLIQAVAPSGVVSVTIEDHTRVYTDKGSTSVTGATLTDDENSDPLAVSTLYHFAYDDPDRVGGTVNFVAYLDSADAAASEANPYRHYVGSLVMPAADGTGSGGGSTPPGWDGGYFCVTDDTPIQMANDAWDGPGDTKLARDVNPGDVLWTQNERTLLWGAFRVVGSSYAFRPVYTLAGHPRATARHRFKDEAGWFNMEDRGELDGTARVWLAKVEFASTYLSQAPTGEWVLSHNIKA